MAAKMERPQHPGSQEPALHPPGFNSHRASPQAASKPCPVPSEETRSWGLPLAGVAESSQGPGSLLTAGSVRVWGLQKGDLNSQMQPVLASKKKKKFCMRFFVWVFFF